ncbi:MAG: DUF3867 domain-containing protein [Intestinibacter sp.]
MSDDRIIDFNELKNKVKETDIDKFENYMYDLYFSVADGSMTMSEFTSKIYDYMRENNISNEKFMNMQKKLLARYGVDEAEIERQLRNMGINPNDLSSMGSMSLDDIRNRNMNMYNNSQNPKVEITPKDDIKETIVKNSDFYNKFANKLEYDSFIISHLKNDVNDLKIVINMEKVTLISTGSINLVDSQLNEFLLDYKNMIGKKMKVSICENCKEYDY